jgi:mRNA-degrading endonuclease RelE of RelBE toxin-antitoxin system
MMGVIWNESGQLSFFVRKLLKYKYAIDDKESMLFIETSIFTKQIKDLVSDEEYRQLQEDLLVQPDRGDLIKNGGGIRKVRCAQGNKGKSGGIRVIYYWVTEDDQIFFLLAYPKSVKDNLTVKETAILRQLVKEQFHG